MSGQTIRSRIQLVVGVLVLALGFGGVALAQRSSGTAQCKITLLDGKLVVSPTTFSAGQVTLVVVNQGKLSHALAITGLGLQAKRTPNLATGKTAKLTVTVQAGSYRIWDPVGGSMSHATVLSVSAPKTTSTTSSSGSMPGSGSSTHVSGSGSAGDAPPMTATAPMN